MTKDKLREGLNYFRAYYINFKALNEHFELDKPFKEKSETAINAINIWYDVLKDIDDESFDILIKDYSLNNDFPPNNPKQLLDHFNKMVKTVYEEIANELWNEEKKYIVSDMNSYSIDLARMYSNSSGIKKELVNARIEKKISNFNFYSVEFYLTETYGKTLTFKNKKVKRNDK